GQCGGADISTAPSSVITDDAVACLRHIYGCSIFRNFSRNEKPRVETRRG
ncbi:hypothetical protein SAMN05421548_1401, partial [Paraburkholderia lycopersici]